MLPSLDFLPEQQSPANAEAETNATQPKTRNNFFIRGEDCRFRDKVKRDGCRRGKCLLASPVLALSFAALCVAVAFALGVTLFSLALLLAVALRFLLLALRGAGLLTLSFLVAALPLLLTIGVAALCGRATPLLLTDVFSAFSGRLGVFTRRFRLLLLDVPTLRITLALLTRLGSLLSIALIPLAFLT